MYCEFSTCNDISCLVGFLFCTSHLLVIRRLSTQSSRGHQKEKLKATPTSTSRSYHHHHSLGRSMSKKGRLYFGFATLELPILQCTLLRWRPQQPRKKLTSTVETYRYLQLSTPETSSSQEFSIFLFVSLCHSSLYLDLSKCFKKNIICHILTSLMFILIHSSFTKSLMLFFSNPFIFAYYSILLIAFASPIFVLHLSSRDRVPYIYRFQNPPPPLFQVWSPWKSLCLLF